MKYFLDKYFEKTNGFYPFFKYCPRIYWDYYICKRASNILGYKYNWKEPKTFNEKLRWLIFNEKLELKTKLADKILVKGYISSKIGCNHSAELYGIYNNFEEIDFSILPEKIAIKANHGWRMNIISKNKNFIYKNYRNINKITKNWLNINYEEFSVEPQYRNINRKLFAEYLRSDKENHLRNELQIYCFHGTPLLCELKKYINNNIGYQLYDTNWKLQNFTHSNIFFAAEEMRPEKLDEILEYSKILSQDFSFVRIDFAYNQNDVHVVEMTFTPCSAIIPFDDIKTDIYLGEMLSLPKKDAKNV